MVLRFSDQTFACWEAAKPGIRSPLYRDVPPDQRGFVFFLSQGRARLQGEVPRRPPARPAGFRFFPASRGDPRDPARPAGFRFFSGFKGRSQGPRPTSGFSFFSGLKGRSQGPRPSPQFDSGRGFWLVDRPPALEPSGPGFDSSFRPAPGEPPRNPPEPPDLLRFFFFWHFGRFLVFGGLQFWPPDRPAPGEAPERCLLDSSFSVLVASLRESASFP